MTKIIPQIEPWGEVYFRHFYGEKHEEGKDNMIIVYSKPACVQCTATTREMDRKGITYNVVDLTKDETAFNTVKDMGYMQAPVVVAGEDHWSGFRPDKIGALA